MTARHSVLYPIFICLFLMGCGRGCTTTSTVDSETKALTKKGVEITFKASVLDYRHSVGRKNNIFDRTVSHNYGLSFNVKLYGNNFGNFFTEALESPDNVDLTAALKRIKVDLSKDKKHLGLGVDGKVVQIIHIYKKRPINVSSFVDSVVGQKWSELDLDAFPSPKSIVMEQVSSNCDFFMMDNAIAIEMLDDYHPSDTMQRMILSKWPECQLAEDYLTEKRTMRLVKNGTWKKYAVKRGLEVIKENRLASWEIEETYEFLNRLNSAKLSRAIDSVYASDWGGKSGQGETEALARRIKSTKRPMNAALKNEIIDKARSEFERYMRTGDSNYKFESANCLILLLASGDKEIAQVFLEDGFKNNMSKYDGFDFVETVYDNFELYTSDQQDFILANTSKLFENSKAYVRSSIFRGVEEYASCKQMKEWLANFPNDLENQRLPDSCKSGSKRK